MVELRQSNRRLCTQCFLLHPLPQPLTHAIEEKCNKAERDNSMIYLEVVPKPERLVLVGCLKVFFLNPSPLFNSIPVVERHALVSADKPLPDFTAPDVMGKDLFQSVVPLEVHKAAQRYNDRRDAEIREIIDSLRKATADSVDALLAMGLPAAIQATENPDTVPQDLLAKCEEIRASGGVRAMEEKISVSGVGCCNF